MATITAEKAPNRDTAKNILVVSPLVVAIAIIANLLLRQITIAIFPISPDFHPLDTYIVAAWTLIGVGGGCVIYAAITRFSSKPVQLFNQVAIMAFILSLLPAIMLLMTHSKPGTTDSSVGTLIAMHIISTIICMGFTAVIKSE